MVGGLLRRIPVIPYFCCLLYFSCSFSPTIILHHVPMDIADWIPADDSVRLLDAILERMDYSQLYAAYSPYGRKAVSPKVLFKILVYGYMNCFYSSREIETACKRDVNFIYLLGGSKPPDHTTIARFCSGLLAQAADAFKSTTKPHLCSRNRQKKTAPPARHRESTNVFRTRQKIQPPATYPRQTQQLLQNRS